MPTAATRISSSLMCRPSIWIASRSSFDRSLASHSRSFAFDRATNYRRLRGAVARDRPDITARQPHRAAELPGRDIDQHLVHRPLAEPVLILRRRPTRQHQFLLALTAANPRAVHPDPTPMKGDLAPGLAPPPALPPVMPLMALTADRRSFLL
jgi:hypothetical protein